MQQLISFGEKGCSAHSGAEMKQVGAKGQREVLEQQLKSALEDTSSQEDIPDQKAAASL